jgi:hypothetical protein
MIASFISRERFKSGKKRIGGRFLPSVLLSCCVFALLAGVAAPLGAQEPYSPCVVRGVVADPSGAMIPGATVMATRPGQATITVTTNARGFYEMRIPLAGKYALIAMAAGFAPAALPDVQVSTQEPQQVNFKLQISAREERVTVQTGAGAEGVSLNNNQGALVILGADFDALADNAGELQTDLLEAAGPATGLDGGRLYVDGFGADQPPPKAGIRSIRINQNPFDPQFDHLGFGRVEIFTQPGTEQFHGQFLVTDNHSLFDARNPFLGDAAQPDYHSDLYSANFSGPLNKNISFFFNLERLDLTDTAVVNATSAAGVPFSQAVLNPRATTNVSPRLDILLTPRNTLTVRYRYDRAADTGDGVGQLSPASFGYDFTSSENVLQAAVTSVLSSQTVNEFRFQYINLHEDQTSDCAAPAVFVQGQFNAGCNPLGNMTDRSSEYEFQNYTSKVVGSHHLRFGGRLRSTRDTNTSAANNNGAFIFSDLADYQNGLPRWYLITYGVPGVQNTMRDGGLYAGDDWQVLPRFNLSYGLRFEAQNNIPKESALSPRLGFSWALGRDGGPPRTVLRAGAGIFYDRFPQDLVMQTERLDGITQQLYYIPGSGTLAPLAQAIYRDCLPAIQSLQSCIPYVGYLTVPVSFYQLDENLRAPYALQTAVTLERQLARNTTASLSYLYSRGLHVLNSRNLNAPEPVTGALPFPDYGQVYEYESNGLFKQSQLMANFRMSAHHGLSLFGHYTLNYASSDTAGATSFPMNQYDLEEDYGRAVFDVRHRAVVGGTLPLPRGFRISPFVVARSGQPFNITVGNDLNDDSIFNDRPASCAAGSTGCQTTPWGNFLIPQAGTSYTPVGVNLGAGPVQFSFNLRFGKTFYFGQETAAPGSAAGGGNRASRRYSLSFAASAHNLFNQVNAAAPLGDLNSTRFGQSIALAPGPWGSLTGANRRIDLQAVFAF